MSWKPSIAFLFIIMLACGLGFIRNTNSRFLSKAANRFSSGVLKASTEVDITGATAVVEHPAYEVLENTIVEEYGLRAILYSHKKSGAQVMSVIAPDENKVFGITLRTPPGDSTGVPHILEHSVLCGSKKYPVKEPFVDLLKGSLQNFLNAFTYPDRTCYPVASTNTKDFYNLISVYLDAVLHPRAVDDPQVLEQEGWHLELENPEDPLTYKGVVYNEMKGVYSSPDSLLGRATQQALFPDNTYGVDSGGDPLAIPDLTFNDFKDFHSKYYHPSNSRIFFYGDDDPMERLILLDKELTQFDKIPVTSQVQFQPKNKKPERLEVMYPIGPDAEPKHSLTVNWLLNDKHLSSYEMLALGVLDSLLLGTSSAKLRKVLTESQLGESVTGGGLSDELLQATFGVGLKGVKPADVQRVEALVLSSLVDITKEGFEDSAVDAAINTLEFRLREFNTGGFPKGLSLMLGMMSNWIYDKNAADGVRFEEALAQLKADLAAKKPVFQDLLSRYIVDNEHRVTVELKPDAELESKQVAEEVDRLKKIKDTLTEDQIKDIVESTKMLKEAQGAEDSPEAKATLPRLDLADIDPESRELPIKVVREGKGADATILTHDLQTSGILYADIGFDFSGLDHEDLPLLPLLTRLMMEGGTASMDEVTLQRKIGAETGGIGVSLYSDTKASGGVVSGVEPSDSLLYLMIRGKATTEKVPVMLGLMKDILMTANLDNKKRAVEMLRESKIRKETSVITSGHTYAASRLASRYSFLGYLGEVTGGITSVREAGKLLDMAENDWETLSARLTKMRDSIVTRNDMIVNLTGDDKVIKPSLKEVDSFLEDLPKSDAAPTNNLAATWSDSKFLGKMENEGFVVPSQVNYVVKGGPIFNPGDAVSGSSSVVSRFLSLHYLWDNVRVMGGAYGGFARFSETSGRFVFMSYRDPNLKGTLDIYDAAADALSNTHVTKEDILQGVIGAVGELDSPLSPDQKGYASMVQFLTGETASERQQWRDEVLKTSDKDFKDFAAALKRVSESGSVAVVGSQAAFDEANKGLPDNNKLNVDKAF